MKIGDILDGGYRHHPYNRALNVLHIEDMYRCQVENLSLAIENHPIGTIAMRYLTLDGQIALGSVEGDSDGSLFIIDGQHRHEVFRRLRMWIVSHHPELEGAFNSIEISTQEYQYESEEGIRMHISRLRRDTHSVPRPDVDDVRDAVAAHFSSLLRSDPHLFTMRAHSSTPDYPDGGMISDRHLHFPYDEIRNYVSKTPRRFHFKLGQIIDKLLSRSWLDMWVTNQHERGVSRDDMLALLVGKINRFNQLLRAAPAKCLVEGPHDNGLNRAIEAVRTRFAADSVTFYAALLTDGLAEQYGEKYMLDIESMREGCTFRQTRVYTDADAVTSRLPRPPAPSPAPRTAPPTATATLSAPAPVPAPAPAPPASPSPPLPPPPLPLRPLDLSHA